MGDLETGRQSRIVTQHFPFHTIATSSAVVGPSSQHFPFRTIAMNLVLVETVFARPGSMITWAEFVPTRVALVEMGDNFEAVKSSAV